MGLNTVPITMSLEEGSIPIRAVLRRLGYPPGIEAVKGGVREILESELIKAGDLITPKCRVRFLQITGRTERITRFELPFTVQSAKVTRLLREAAYGAFFFVTIGSRLEEEVARLTEQGELTRGMVLDAIGSETVESYAGMVHREKIKEVAENNGFSVTPRFSPGFGGWTLSVQRELADLCEAYKIGIQLNASFLMSPRKSVSAVFGLVRHETGR